jgi:hypothetical protein
VYTNPPDSNSPAIDHGLDEGHIWAFNVTAYNQFHIKNNYTRNLWSTTKNFHLPFWGQKLFTPTFYKDDKFTKFIRQWGVRINFEMIKMRHAIVARRGDYA